MKVLLIEDESRVADALSRGLRADGFTVDHASDGYEGLWLAQEHAYSVVVLDLLLPGLNGYRICSQLREAGNETPILVLTAKHGDEDLIEGLEAGADDFMTKPFTYRVLLARIRALVRRSANKPTARVLRAGTLAFDLYAQRITVGGNELKLSPRAMAVLEFLLRNQGSVVSKQAILDSVWECDFNGDPNIVEVYVSRIRQALDVAAADLEIETVRGLGYRFRIRR
ncbi:MAG: response regulator transcription factor [Acidimicrobiales bacterium]